MPQSIVAAIEVVSCCILRSDKRGLPCGFDLFGGRPDTETSNQSPPFEIEQWQALSSTLCAGCVLLPAEGEFWRLESMSEYHDPQLSE
jgi:hypothetical protein